MVVSYCKLHGSPDILDTAVRLRAVANWSKKFFVLVGVGVGVGEVVDDPNDDEEKRAVALEGEDARFAPKLREAVARQEVRVRLLPRCPLWRPPLSVIFNLHTSFSHVAYSYSSKPSICS
eukprot:1808454-Pleurochrysis_carterae.AAC.1